MIVFNKFRDLQDHYPEISEHIRSVISADDLEEEFSWSLGGDVHIIDTQEEYLHISRGNEYWDVAEEAMPGWFLLVDINNNGGGPSYYIPTAILPEGDRPVSYNA